MKITRLELTNFRAATGLVLNLDAPRVLVVGTNGSGKTSCREAIRWLLRGLSEVTDQRGSGQDLLAPHGTQEVSAKLQLAGVGEVTRVHHTVGGSAFAVDTFTGTAGTQQQALYAKLQTSPEMLDAVLDTETFGRLHHADATALVLGLLNVKVRVPTRVLSSNDEVYSEYSLDELDIKWRTAFDQRKDAKRRLTVLPPVAAVPFPDTVKAMMERTESSSPADLLLKIETRLGELRTEQGELRQAIGETIGKRSALQAERERVEKLTKTQPSDNTALEQQRVDLQGEIANATYDPVRPAASPGQQVIQILRSKAEALEQHQPSGGCVLDGDVPCKTPAKQFALRAGAVRQEADILSQQQPASAVANPRNLQRELQAIQDQLKKAYQQRAAIEQAGGRLAEIDEDLSSLPETTEQEATLAELAEKISRGETLQKETQAYQQALAAADKALESRKALTDEVSRLETLVEQLGPKGLRVAALEAAMGKFETAINAYLATWGWTVEFEVEPWTVHVNGREWKTYSKSERYRIGLGVQFALAQLSGLSFALVDEADMLDVEKRRALAGMVNEAPLEQIIMFSTREPGEKLPAPHEGWIFIRLHESRVIEIVQPSAAA